MTVVGVGATFSPCSAREEAAIIHPSLGLSPLGPCLQLLEYKKYPFLEKKNYGIYNSCRKLHQCVFLHEEGYRSDSEMPR